MFYFRRGDGPRTRLLEQYGTPEFSHEYALAFAESAGLPTPNAPPAGRRTRGGLDADHGVDDQARAVIRSQIPEGILCEADASVTFVYFIRVEKMVKIGFAKDVRKRAKTLRTASFSHLEIALTICGGRRLEEFFHELFFEERTYGEWFKFSKRVKDFVAGKRLPTPPTEMEGESDFVY